MSSNGEKHLSLLCMFIKQNPVQAQMHNQAHTVLDIFVFENGKLK